MLTPEQLQALPQPIIDLYNELNTFILVDIARRIKKAGGITPTAEYQIYRAQALGLSAMLIRDKIAEINGMAKSEVNRLIKEAARLSDEFDRRMLKAAKTAAIPLSENTWLQQIIDAQIRQAQGAIDNITGTTGFAFRNAAGKTEFMDVTSMLRRQMDKAHNQIVTGAVDHNTAIRRATNELIESGVRTVNYESGRTDRIDVAARRAVMTGTSQVTNRISEANYELLGANGWEISAHSGARPSHAVYQGKQFPESEYGTIVRPLLDDYNCRHSAFPIILGVNEPVYTAEKLANIDLPPVTYEGKTYTAYEATQEQRRMERVIRKQKDRLVVAEATGDKEAFTAASIRLKQQERIYEDFSDKVGLYTQKERTQVYGFNRSIAQKAVHANKKDFNHYKQLLGDKNLPESLAEFNEMRYNRDGRYLQLKSDYEKRLKTASFETVSKIKGGVSDRDARIWYDSQIKKISGSIDKTADLESQARQAHAIRNTIRTQARDIMENQEKRQALDNRHPNGDFESTLLDKMVRKSLTREEALKDIVGTASKSNKNVNDILGVE